LIIDLNKQFAVARSARLRGLLIIAAFAGAGSFGADLEGIRVHEAPEHTRVVFDTNKAVDFSVSLLERPRRVVIDLSHTVPKYSLVVPEARGTLINRIRKARRNDGSYRVVLDVSQSVDPKSFTLAPISPHGHRLVVDLFTNRPKKKTPTFRSLEGFRDVVIALDAGHGGEDPGAIGVGRVLEKEVVYSIARLLERKLNQMNGFRVVMVRKGDYYVSLRKRTSIAREHRADLFVSIHADAFNLPVVRGASVYALTEDGASSETALWLAKKENRSDLIGGVGGSVSLDEYDEGTRSVLLDLSMEGTLFSSITAGESVLGALADVCQVHKRRVEQAGFVVLKSPDVPSILVETGFLSNPEEARLLATAPYQKRLAYAIAEGIQAYMLRHPPVDSLIAMLEDRGTMRHLIRRGDTLSGIAQRYQISTRLLRAVNGITGDRIRAGQVLVIPGAAGS
jgi:N-acetylmuramoyl-L-alanine amidase